MQIVHRSLLDNQCQSGNIISYLTVAYVPQYENSLKPKQSKAKQIKKSRYVSSKQKKLYMILAGLPRVWSDLSGVSLAAAVIQISVRHSNPWSSSRVTYCGPLFLALGSLDLVSHKWSGTMEATDTQLRDCGPPSPAGSSYLAKRM
jgi:hypothetical protein